MNIVCQGWHAYTGANEITTPYHRVFHVIAIIYILALLKMYHWKCAGNVMHTAELYLN